MKLPKVVYVGAADYAVREKKHMSTPEYLGETLNENTEIQIRFKQSSPSKRDSLLHECLHAIVWSSGMCHAFGLGNEEEEKLIRWLTPWILALLRDNPALVEYLTDKPEEY